MSGNVKNIFIISAHEDNAILQDFKDLLQQKGCEIRDDSIDTSKLPEGSNEESIKSEILAPDICWASTLIVLLSPNTCTNPQADWEIEYAQKQGKRIIGVWIQEDEECDIPKNLKLYADAVVICQGDQVIGAIDGEINDWYNPDGQKRLVQCIKRYDCN